jgi:hypothetical protein
LRAGREAERSRALKRRLVVAGFLVASAAVAALEFHTQIGALFGTAADQIQTGLSDSVLPEFSNAIQHVPGLKDQ